jgi:hypothetical protein
VLPSLVTCVVVVVVVAEALCIPFALIPSRRDANDMWCSMRGEKLIGNTSTSQSRVSVESFS